MPTQTRNPGTVVDDDSFGSLPWTNPSGAAVAGVDAAETTSASPGDVSHYLVGSGFGFTLPDYAEVVGIRVDWTIVASGNNTRDSRARIVKGGVIGSTDNSNATDWHTFGTAFVNQHGGSTDLWGETWTAADINGSDFGAALAWLDNDGGATGTVDACEVTVFFNADVEGSAALTMGAMTCASDGQWIGLIEGTAALSMGSMTAQAAGLYFVPVEGSADLTMGGMTSAAVGNVTCIGQAGLTMGAMTCVGSGQFTGSAEGSAALTMGAMTCAGSATFIAAPSAVGGPYSVAVSRLFVAGAVASQPFVAGTAAGRCL